MERGEGIALAKQYKIGGYPTFLYTDGEGTMLHSDAGFKDTTLFLEMCQLAQEPTKRLAGMDADFLKGNYNNDFLKAYIDKRTILMNGSQNTAIEAYLKNQPDWSQPEILDFIMAYIQNPASLGFLYMVEKKDKFIARHGADRVNRLIESIVYQELTRCTHRAGVEAMSKLFSLLYPEDVASLYIAKYKTIYAIATTDDNALMEAIASYTKQFPPEDPAEWADLAVNLSLISKNKSYLKKATTWLDDSLKKEETFECQIAKAYVLKAMKKQKKAKKQAEKTIEWAKAKNENYEPATQFLSTLKQ
jgi:hypothetical protein